MLYQQGLMRQSIAYSGRRGILQPKQRRAMMNAPMNATSPKVRRLSVATFWYWQIGIRSLYLIGPKSARRTHRSFTTFRLEDVHNGIFDQYLIASDHCDIPQSGVQIKSLLKVSVSPVIRPATDVWSLKSRMAWVASVGNVPWLFFLKNYHQIVDQINQDVYSRYICPHLVEILGRCR